MNKTLEQKSNHSGFPKAKEVVELAGAGTGKLTMGDRRVLNILFEHAHNINGLASDFEFEITMQELKTAHKETARINDSLDRLMSVVVEVQTVVNNKPKIVKTHLFDFTESDVDENDLEAIVRYGIPKKLQKVLKNSGRWGRIKAEIVMAMTSKYGISLYELLQVRAGLSHQFQEEFPLDKFRELMGVPEGKLLKSSDLIKRVMAPAEIEVNGLSELNVKLEPMRRGNSPRGKLLGIRMSWWKKTPEEFRSAKEELKRHRVGRIARLNGTAEKLADEAAARKSKIEEELSGEVPKR